MRGTTFWIGLLAALSAGCGTHDDPYARLTDVPLVQARLQTITLAGNAAGLGEQIRLAGYEPVTLPPNYPQATAVEAAVWGVPADAAAQARYFKSTTPGKPDLRWLAVTPRAAGAPADQAFFEKVLGSEVPRSPLKQSATLGSGVQAWTFLVPDVLEANRRLRDAGIPVIHDPVAITTAYLGDHRMLAIRAPDGTVVQLVESAAQ